MLDNWKFDVCMSGNNIWYVSCDEWKHKHYIVRNLQLVKTIYSMLTVMNVNHI